MMKYTALILLFVLIGINFIFVYYASEVGDWLNSLPRYVKPTLQGAIVVGWIFLLYSIRKILNSKK